MSSQAEFLPDLEFHPVTAERWQDLETLFGKNGAYSNCWCMWWRMTRSAFDKQTGQEKKQALKAIVDADKVPGFLAYAHDQSIAWCSIAPRESYPSLERSWVLKRVDDEPVWSIVCFFVAKPFRRQGLMVQLLKAAIEYAREHGAKIAEGYPVELKESEFSGASGFTGIMSAFREAGFVEVLRRSEKRPIMRYFMQKGANNGKSEPYREV